MKFISFNKISFKLNFFLLCIALLPLFTYWLLTYNSIQKITSYHMSLLEQQSREAARVVDVTIERGILDAKLLSRMVEPRIALYFGRYNSVQDLFNKVIEMNKTYGIIVLYDKDGKIVTKNNNILDGHSAMVEDLSVNEQSKKALAEVASGVDYSINMIESPRDRSVNYIQVISPILTGKSEYMGSVGINIVFSSVEQTMNGLMASLKYNDKSIYMANMNDGYIFHSFSQITQESSQLLQADKIVFCEPITSYATINMSLSACVSVSAGEVNAISKLQTIRLVVISLIVMVLIIVLTIYVTMYFTKPIKTLLERTSAYISDAFIGGTNFTRREDEFGVLNKHFDQLMDDIERYRMQAMKNASLVAIGESTAMVAHDVRKPLTSMKALLTALPVIKDNPTEMAKMVTSVDRNITQVNQMLSDVLEFSKDATSLNLTNENPQGIITAALTDALRNHQGSKIKISYSLNHTHLLKVDGARIIRVLVNIIDNALDAMTPKGGVAEGEIKIGTEDVGATGWSPVPSNGQNALGDMLRITISDSGPGIPEDVLPKIFDPFVTKGKIGGTGLGLAICHKIIDMHGGKIEAGNLPHPDLPLTKGKGHKGAQFVIELPMSDEAAIPINEGELIHDSNEMEVFRKEEAARPEYGDSANTAEFMRINKERGRMSYLLIVDDEPLFRETVRCLLSDIPQVKDHVKFVEADSAEVALDTMSKQEFDYVISDIDLGKNRMNGYEFSREILETTGDGANYPINRLVPSPTRVVIHSNKRKEEMDKSIRQIKNERFMGFLPKPMSQSELLQFLACKTFEVVGAGSPRPSGMGATIAGADTAPLQERKKKILVLNDDDTVLMMYKYVLKSPAHQVLTASNVSDAMKLYMEEGIDVILSDINLGEDQPDGYDFLKQIRERDKNVRFYFASGYSIKEHEARAMAAGANAYFQNPIEDSAFKEILS